MANQIVDFYRQQNPGYTGTDDSITLLYAEEYANELPHLLKSYPDFATDYNKIYDHAFPITAGDRAKQVAGSLIRGVAGTVAAIPEAVGIARVEALGRGLGVGTTDYRETLMGQLATGIRGVGEWASPEVAEAKAENMADDFFTTIVPGAFGSGIGFLTTGGLTGIGVRGAAGGLIKAGGAKATAREVGRKAKAIPSVRSWDTARKKVVVQKAGKEAGERYAKKKARQINTGSIAALGSAANATAGYKDALANGGTPEQALSSYLLNGVVGLSEATPLARMLNRLDNASGGTFMYYLSNAAPEVFEEALQETFQGVAGDIIAANIVKYDPDRVMYEHLKQDAGAGGISGGLLSLITSALSRKARLLGDEKAERFVEGEGIVPGFEGGETVEDARKRYTGGREGDISKLAMLVSLQRQDDPTGEDQEGWAKLKQAHEAVIGDDADAQMIFEAALFEVGSTLAADRAEGIITTELGKVANPEKRKSAAIEPTISLSPADIIGAEEELDPDLEENFADFKGQLLEQRNALVGELMEVNNNINLAKGGTSASDRAWLIGAQSWRDLQGPEGLIGDEAAESTVTDEQKAAYEQMLVGKREELSGQIQAINAEIAGVDQRLSEVGRVTPKVDLVDAPQTFDPEARKIETEQALDIEERLVARLREELAELEELEKEEAFTAEQQEYWDSLHQDLADDREALEQLREEMEAELLDRLAALETTDTSEFSEEDLQGHAELVEITRGQLEGGVTAGQAAAAAGLTSDQLSRLVRYTDGNTDWNKHRPAPATLVPRRTEGARTVGPIGESLERRKARLEGIVEGKSRKGWSFSAGRFVSKPIPKKEKEDARIELDKINADLARIVEAETVVRGPDQLTAGELNASIKGQRQYIRLLQNRVDAGETVFKGTGESILAEIESRRKLVEDLEAKHATKKKAQAAAAEFNSEKNAKKSHSIGIEQAIDTAGEKSEKADKRFDRLVGQLEAATPAERDALNKERASIPVVTALDKQIQSNIKKIDNLEGRAAKAKRQKTKDKFQQQANNIKAENTKLSLEKRQILGVEAGLTMEEAADPAVEVKETKKTARETIVDDWINTKNEVEQQQRNLRDAGKREVLDVRNVEIITHFAAKDPGKGQTPTSVEFGSNKQDRELKAGPAYYEIGTDDATQATGWGREATETLRKYQEATTEEERTELAQKLASQLARGANVRQTSGVSRRLISFVAPDKKIWVLGISRSGKDKSSYSLVPPKTDPNDKVGYEGVLFEDLLAQGFIPFAAIRLRNPAYRMNYKVESAEEYQNIVAPIKLEVVDTPAFLEQVSQGPVSKTVSLDAIISKVEPVFEEPGVITETEDALERAEKPAETEERPVHDITVEDVPVTILTEEGAGNVFDILTKASAAPTGEVVVDEETGLVVQSGEEGISIEEALDEAIASDEQLDNLVETLGRASATKGIRFVEFLTDHILKIYEENAGSKEAFVKAFLGSESAQIIGEQIRAEAFNEELRRGDTNQQLDELTARRQDAESDPNSREDTVSEEEADPVVPLDKPFMSVPLGFGATGRTAGYSSFDRVCEVCTGKVMELAKKMGLPVTYAVIDAKSPVTEGNISHWVAVVNIDGQLYVVDDPQTNLIENAPELPKVESERERYIGEAPEMEGQARVIKDTFDPVLIPVTKEALGAAYGQTVKEEEVITKGIMKGEVFSDSYNQVESNIETITKAAAEIGGATETAEAPAPSPAAIEINSEGKTVRMTSEQHQDPAFRKANKLAKLEYFVDEKTGKKMLVNQPSSGPDIARGRNAPDRPDSAYPRVPQRKLNKIFTYLIERLRTLGVQVEITEREFANAATKAKAMFGFANGKPVIVLAMNSLENPTTQNLFDLLHEIGHAVTADMPQKARLRVLAAIAKLNDSVLKIPGRKYRIPLDEAGEIDSEIEQEERLVEAIAQALVSENFDPTTANTLASKIVRFFRNLMLAVKQAFHRMMGHEGEVAMNYFKVQVEAMLTGKEAPAYLSWVSGYKYSVSERMDSMELEDSDSVIDSIYDLASFSKEYKLVVGDSPEAVEHNIRWAGIRFTVEREDLSPEDLAAAKMRAQRIIASENALNEILTGLYDTFRRTAGSRYAGLDKDTFINYLTNGSLPNERIKAAVAASKDESLVNTQMQDLEGEEAKQSAAVMLHKHLSKIETRLKTLNNEANIELSESVPGSTLNKQKKQQQTLVELTARYENLDFMQDHIYKISEELIKGMAEKTDKTIPRVLKELGLKATAKEIEAARNKRLNSNFIDALEYLSTEITEWGRGTAESIQEKIALLGNPVTDILNDPATLALAISIGRNQKAALSLLALRREGDFEGMKQAFNKAVSAAMSGDPKTALKGWNTKVSSSSRKDAAFERITTKLRKVLAKLGEAQTKSDATREDLENYERQNALYEKLSEPLAQYQEEVGAIFGKESILPDWFENISHQGKEWSAVDGALYVVPPDPTATLNDLKNPANHRSLDLMNIKNIGEMVRHIEKMNAWLQAQPIERRGGEYNMIKRMVDRMTEVQAIQYHRELSNSFVVRHMGSLTDRLEMVGSPAASKIAAQLQRFAYYLASYAGHGTKSAIRNGKLWSNKLQKARHKINKAGNLEFGGGHIDLSTFKRVLYGPAMQYFHHRRDILNDAPNRDTGEDRLIESWLNHKAAESPAWKPIIDAARSELRAFYKQTAVNSRQIADVASKMGVLVYDEEGGYFRERIGSSLTTTMRQTNDVAKNVWRFISPTWGYNKRTASELAGTSEKPDAQNLSVEEFDAYVMNRFGDLRTINEFVAPLVNRPGSSVFYDIDGSVLPRKWVMDSLKENPDNMVGFLNALTQRARIENEDVREFQAGVVNRFQNFFDKLDSVVDQQHKSNGFLGGKSAVPIHIMMDARKFNDFPLEWVDYADFTERRMYQFVKNLSAEAAFGRDMVQVHNDFDLARNDINAAKAMHEEIVNEIGKLGFFSKLGPAWLNWGKRSYYKKYDEQAVDKQAKMAGPKYSGKFLRKSVSTGRLIDGIEAYFKAYMAKERDSALEFTVWNELIRALTGLIVQSPGTALVDTIAIVEQPYRKMGFNKFGFQMMLKNITGSFGIGAGSFFQVFNRSIKFAHDDMAKMMELGLDDATASLEGGWFKRLATEFRSNMSDEMVGQNMLTRGVEKTARGIRAFLEAGKGRPEEGRGAFPVFRPQAIFSQIAKQSAMANTLTTWKMFRNFVANAADYIEAHPETMKLYQEKGMIFNENALGAEGLNNALDEMGYGRSFLFFSNKKAYHNMYNTLIEGGFNLEKVALDYIERRKADSKADPLAAGYAPNNTLLMALAHTTTSQVMLETDVTTRSPMFLTNSFGYASMPLLGWSWQKFVDINKSMASDRSAHGAFLGTIESLKTYLAIFPIGLIYAFLRDEYDEEIVGKKSSLQSGKGLFFKGDGMPSIKEIQTDPYNSLQVAVERFDRVGIFGLGGEVLNTTLNAGSAREMGIDSRVYALNTLRTTGRVLTALALQRPQNATYATIYRPLLSGYGGSGFLQYGQILNNAMAKMGGDPLFETEYAMAQRIGTNNFLRAAGRYLDMDVRTFSGTRGITTTRMRPWVSDMLMAAVVDDEQWFDESWRRAVEEAEAMGKTDPIDTVKRSFQAYHPLRYIYQTMPTELEYLGILNSIEETSGIEGKIQVQQTIRNINDYGTLLGITPSEGKVERAPTKTSVKTKLRRELFGDSFRKPNKQDILTMVSGL